MSHHDTPWTDSNQLLVNHAGTWEQVDEATLASKHTSASLRFILARIADIRPPFGQSLFTKVLHKAPGRNSTTTRFSPCSPSSTAPTSSVSRPPKRY